MMWLLVEYALLKITVDDEIIKQVIKLYQLFRFTDNKLWAARKRNESTGYEN